jgi:hypothetical protein
MVIMESGVSPSRKYRINMLTEDGKSVTKVVTLPATLINNPATVEIWYHAYVPKGHLIVDIEPAETVDEGEDPAEQVGELVEKLKSKEDDRGESFVSFDRVTPAEAVEDEPIVDKEPQYVGFGNSLEYVGEDEPIDEDSEEDETRLPSLNHPSGK